MTAAAHPWILILAGLGQAAARPARVRVDATPTRSESMAMDAVDREDIQASLSGDGQAYARLVRKYQERVAARLWKFTRDHGELDELVQETFVQAYLSLKRFRGDAPLEHWLMKIATRVGYACWKKRSRTTTQLEPRDWDGIADGKSGAQAAGESLVELLACLPPRDRLVLMLLYVEGRSVAEAAALAGWSQTMVKVQAFRARRKLKAALVKAGYTGKEL